MIVDQKRRSWQPALALALSLAFIAFAAMTMARYMGCERESARRSYCTSHLKLIGAAMHAYHDRYGCLPPAVVNDTAGNPAHSWRALLLPYIGHPELAARYRFDQPWDGPDNRKLWLLRPEVYRCPSDPSSGVDACLTNYVVVTGPATLFDGNRYLSVSDIAATVSDTIFVVEIADSDICWLEPRDLDIRTMALPVGSPMGNNISSYHDAGAQVITVDGAPHTLRASIDGRDLQALLTPMSPLRKAAAKRALGPPEGD